MTTTFKGIDPSTGQRVGAHVGASPDAAAEAASQAARAAADPRLADAVRRVVALRTTASRLRANADAIVTAASQETGLPVVPRLRGELERTCRQLEAFAAVVEEGSYVEAIIDPADPDALPIPRPDLRRMLHPVGPVAVFGASNFPLAFSTAGGDTASALAAGCPVVVKGHPMHPATGALVAAEITAAVAEAGLPEGTFTHLLASGIEIGEALVDATEIRAVAFTGSAAGGRALMDRAAARPAPIPVFAEMGSLNPLVITPGALASRAQALVGGLVASVATVGGQLCTKPGLAFVPRGAAGDAFAAAVADACDARPAEVLLGPAILARFRAGLDALDGVEELTRGRRARGGRAAGEPGGGAAGQSGGGAGGEPGGAAAEEPGGAVAEEPGFRAVPVVLQAQVGELTGGLAEEHFGPAVVLVRYDALDEVVAALRALGGQLTLTLHAEPGEPIEALVAAGRALAGRVLFGGFPTGVAVSWAMTHGGPWPASSSSHTSVGMTAITRFLRPVTLQDAPTAHLPPALQDGNPLGIWRRVDGELTRD